MMIDLVVTKYPSEADWQTACEKAGLPVNAMKPPTVEKKHELLCHRDPTANDLRFSFALDGVSASMVMHFCLWLLGSRTDADISVRTSACLCIPDSEVTDPTRMTVDCTAFGLVYMAHTCLPYTVPAEIRSIAIALCCRVEELFPEFIGVLNENKCDF